MVAILQIVTTIMITLLLVSMMAKARPWRRLEVPGKLLESVPVGFLPKLLSYRSSLLALLMGCALSTLAGWIPLNMAFTVMAFAFLILLVPMRYTLTTKGVAVGQSVFRPWSDFSGLKVNRSSVELMHPSNFGRLTLFVKPAEMDNVLKHAQRHVKFQSSKSNEGE
jgi:hypothetical protein